MKPKTPAHPLIAASTEETLYRTASIIAFVASRSDPDDQDTDATFGRELILNMCTEALLHEAERSAHTAAAEVNRAASAR
jgi:hypothetical protein